MSLSKSMDSPYELPHRDHGSAETQSDSWVTLLQLPGFWNPEVRGHWLPFVILFLQQAKKATCTGPVHTHLHLRACESSNCVEQQHRLCCIGVALSSNDQYAPIHKKDWRMQRITTAHPEPFTHKRTLTPACASLSHAFLTTDADPSRREPVGAV